MNRWTMQFSFSVKKGDIDPYKLNDACAAAARALGLESGNIEPGARIKFSSARRRPKKKSVRR